MKKKLIVVFLVSVGVAMSAYALPNLKQDKRSITDSKAVKGKAIKDLKTNKDAKTPETPKAKPQGPNDIVAKCIASKNEAKSFPACELEGLQTILKDAGCKSMGGGGGANTSGTAKTNYSATVFTTNCRQVETGSTCLPGEKSAYFQTISNNMGQNNQVCVK